MPAKSEKQRRMMGAALSLKRGKFKGKPSKALRDLANSMSEKELSDFAKKAEASEIVKEAISKAWLQRAVAKRSANQRFWKQLLGMSDDLPGFDEMSAAARGVLERMPPEKIQGKSWDEIRDIVNSAMDAGAVSSRAALEASYLDPSRLAPRFSVPGEAQASRVGSKLFNFVDEGELLDNFTKRLAKASEIPDPAARKMAIDTIHMEARNMGIPDISKLREGQLRPLRKSVDKTNKAVGPQVSHHNMTLAKEVSEGLTTSNALERAMEIAATGDSVRQARFLDAMNSLGVPAGSMDEVVEALRTTGVSIPTPNQMAFKVRQNRYTPGSVHIDDPVSGYEASLGRGEKGTTNFHWGSLSHPEHEALTDTLSNQFIADVMGSSRGEKMFDLKNELVGRVQDVIAKAGPADEAQKAKLVSQEMKKFLTEYGPSGPTGMTDRFKNTLKMFPEELGVDTNPGHDQVLGLYGTFGMGPVGRNTVFRPGSNKDLGASQFKEFLGTRPAHIVTATIAEDVANAGKKVTDELKRRILLGGQSPVGGLSAEAVGDVGEALRRSARSSGDIVTQARSSAYRPGAREAMEASPLTALYENRPRIGEFDDILGSVREGSPAPDFENLLADAFNDLDMSGTARPTPRPTPTPTPTPTPVPLQIDTDALAGAVENIHTRPSLQNAVDDIVSGLGGGTQETLEPGIAEAIRSAIGRFSGTREEPWTRRAARYASKQASAEDMVKEAISKKWLQEAVAKRAANQRFWKELLGKVDQVDDFVKLDPATRGILERIPPERVKGKSVDEVIGMVNDAKEAARTANFRAASGSGAGQVNPRYAMPGEEQASRIGTSLFNFVDEGPLRQEWQELLQRGDEKGLQEFMKKIRGYGIKDPNVLSEGRLRPILPGGPEVLKAVKAGVDQEQLQAMLSERIKSIMELERAGHLEFGPNHPFRAFLKQFGIKKPKGVDPKDWKLSDALEAVERGEAVIPGKTQLRLEKATPGKLKPGRISATEPLSQYNTVVEPGQPGTMNLHWSTLTHPKYTELSDTLHSQFLNDVLRGASEESRNLRQTLSENISKGVLSAGPKATADEKATAVRAAVDKFMNENAPQGPLDLKRRFSSARKMMPEELGIATEPGHPQVRGLYGSYGMGPINQGIVFRQGGPSTLGAETFARAHGVGANRFVSDAANMHRAEMAERVLNRVKRMPLDEVNALGLDPDSLGEIGGILGSKADELRSAVAKNMSGLSDLPPRRPTTDAELRAIIESPLGSLYANSPRPGEFDDVLSSVMDTVKSGAAEDVVRGSLTKLLRMAK